MSLDLFKEFGYEQPAIEENPWGQAQSYGQHTANAADADDFGDFEEPDNGKPATSQGLTDGGLVDISEPQPAPDPEILVQSQSKDDVYEAIEEDAKKSRIALRGQLAYETGIKERFAEQQKKYPTLLVGKNVSDFYAHQGAKHDQEMKRSRELPSSNSSENGATALEADQEDDDWGDFIDQEQLVDVDPQASQEDPSIANDQAQNLTPKPEPAAPSLHITHPSAIGTKPKILTTSTTTTSRQASKTPNAQAPPPSNIPPPSILLLLAATLFQSLPAEIKQLVASMKPHASEVAGPEQSAIDEILLRLSYTRAIARVIAGRKQRWKRDTHLAQSMKIGPAEAGRSSGMKLTGIDRQESRREDQEAAEVVRIWKQHAGSLRASIASANAQYASKNLAFPEIETNMPVRIAKAGEGALTAPKCCFLCGLKRDERVQKIDIDIEDSFGEYWIEHWGHLDCKAFWEAHERSLQHR